MTEPVRDPALEEVPGVAEVALNVPLRRVFDYRVPEALAGLLEPGSRVIVPFGVRVRSGIVVGLKARSALAPERLKEVQRVTGAAPLFPPELLPFTRWVADYYLCGWGEVLEAALPSGLGVKFRAEYRARPEARSEKGLRGLSPGCRALVASGEPWDDAAWSRAAKDPAEGVADRRWLARQTRSGGLVEVRHEFAGTKARHLMERWVRLLPGVRVPPLRQRAGKETRAERVLALLRAEGDVPLANLATAAKDPAAVVRELTAKGWVEVYERRGE
ncbi:MAG: hypothetical protein OEW39_12100, partial [Deltaproteobacteria bacterium]|nr:hypothetical protein [Deltaproteobacteria bacterium]